MYIVSQSEGILLELGEFSLVKYCMIGRQVSQWGWTVYYVCQYIPVLHKVDWSFPGGQSSTHPYTRLQ